MREGELYKSDDLSAKHEEGELYKPDDLSAKILLNKHVYTREDGYFMLFFSQTGNSHDT